MYFLTLSLLVAPASELSPGKLMPSLPATGNQCASISASEARACIGARMRSKELLLRVVLGTARKRVAESHANYGYWDGRTAPAHLDQSQAAWSAYVEANCTVAAAFGGGSNSAISDRFTSCFEDELDRRIAFLRALPDGTGSSEK